MPFKVRLTSTVTADGQSVHMLCYKLKDLVEPKTVVVPTIGGPKIVLYFTAGKYDEAYFKEHMDVCVLPLLEENMAKQLVIDKDYDGSTVHLLDGELAQINALLKMAATTKEQENETLDITDTVEEQVSAYEALPNTESTGDVPVLPHLDVQVPEDATDLRKMLLEHLRLGKSAAASTSFQQACDLMALFKTLKRYLQNMEWVDSKIKSEEATAKRVFNTYSSLLAHAITTAGVKVYNKNGEAKSMTPHHLRRITEGTFLMRELIAEHATPQKIGQGFRLACLQEAQEKKWRPAFEKMAPEAWGRIEGEQQQKIVDSMGEMLQEYQRGRISEATMTRCFVPLSARHEEDEAAGRAYGDSLGTLIRRRAVWFNKPEYLADERRAAAEFEEKEAVEAEVLKVKRDALTVARESAKESERKRKAYQEDNQEKNKTIKALKEESKALREEVKRLYKACEASPMLIEKWLGQTSLSPDMQITKNGHTVARKKRLKKATR
jgi:hypothetical protein